MNRMRKGLAALAAAVFFLNVGSVAQAVIGIPDDVPGSTLLYPFFKVNPIRTTLEQQDTLLVISNTAGPTTRLQSALAPDIAVHMTLWSATSDHVFDFSVRMTPHDAWTCSLFDLILGEGCDQVQPAPPQVKDALTTMVDGKPLLVGYATADVVFERTSSFPGQVNYPYGYGNVLIGHLYLVNLAAGSSTGLNAVSIETDNPCYGHNAIPVTGQVDQNSRGFYRTRCEQEQVSNPAACSPVRLAGPPSSPLCPDGGGRGTAYGDLTERIDGPNGDWHQTITAGGYQAGPTIANISPDSPLSLLVRYFSVPALKGRSEVWLWKDRTTSGAAGDVNVAVYDEDENVHSVQLRLPDEVNFAVTSQIITPGALGGWFRIKYPCSQFGSCAYNYLNPPSQPVPPSTTAVAARPPIQAVAYSVQFAQDNPLLRWDATFPAHRQYTNYLGVND